MKLLCLFVFFCAFAFCDPLRTFLDYKKFHAEIEWRFWDFRNLEVPQVIDHDITSGRHSLKFYRDLEHSIIFDKKPSYVVLVNKDHQICNKGTGEVQPVPEIGNLTEAGIVWVHGIECKKYVHYDDLGYVGLYLDVNKGFPVRVDAPRYQVDVRNFIPDFVDESAFEIPKLCTSDTPIHTSLPSQVMKIASWLGPLPLVDLSPSRAKTLQENSRLIDQTNRQAKSPSDLRLRAGPFSHLSYDEFIAQYAMPPMKAPTPAQLAARGVLSHRAVANTSMFPDGLPEEVDWTRVGMVTPVKNQASCGSCWSFGAISAVESHFAIHHPEKKLLSFSEQNLVDCAWFDPYGNMGCNGGWGLNAMQYLLDKQGGAAVLQTDYPYLMRNSYCQKKLSFPKGPRIQSLVTVSTEDELMEAVATKGPISIHVYVSTKFQHYGSGIFEDPDCNVGMTNHVVGLVGYGTTADGQKYWKIKNSWGTNWGVDGYMYLRRGTDECHLTEQAVYPVMK